MKTIFKKLAGQANKIFGQVITEMEGPNGQVNQHYVEDLNAAAALANALSDFCENAHELYEDQ